MSLQLHLQHKFSSSLLQLHLQHELSLSLLQLHLLHEFSLSSLLKNLHIKQKLINTIRNKNKDGNVLETTCSNYVIIEGDYGKKEYEDEISFDFVRVPYDIKEELKDVDKNIEKESYQYELENGMYRSMDKVNENFRRLGIDTDKI